MLRKSGSLQPPKSSPQNAYGGDPGPLLGHHYDEDCGHFGGFERGTLGSGHGHVMYHLIKSSYAIALCSTRKPRCMIGKLLQALYTSLRKVSFCVRLEPWARVWFLCKVGTMGPGMSQILRRPYAAIIEAKKLYKPKQRPIIRVVVLLEAWVSGAL